MTPKEIELLSELTIIIPTYNRPLELERAIEYWRDTPVTVHILDGSEKPWFFEGCQPDTKSIFYHSFQPRDESPTENWGRRLKFGAGEIRTRFAALCCDDDVFEVSGLVCALRLLKSEPSIDAVIGRTGEYLAAESQINWCHKYSNWKDEEYRKSDNMHHRFVCDDGVHAFYGIYKSEKLKLIHSLSHKFEFPVPVWHSSLVIHMTKVFCRIKLIDSLLWLKHGINNAEARPIKFAPLFYDRKYAAHRKNFVSAIAEAIEIAKPNISGREIEEMISDFSAQYKRPRKTSKKLVNLKAKVLKKLGSLPFAIRNQIFLSLSENLKTRLGNSNFEVNWTPKYELSSEDLSLDYLLRWERILMMPREELRLRANI